MLCIKSLRNNIDEIATKLLIRGYKLDKEKFYDLENKRKKLQVEVENLRNERNIRSKEIGTIKAQGQDISPLKAEVNKIAERMAALENELKLVLQELDDFLLNIPNIPHNSVPLGKSEADNLEIRKVGTPREFNFPILDHVDLGEKLGLLDFAAASKLSGSRFVVMKGAIAKLHRAIAQFMLSVHTDEHGYQEVNVPYIVNNECLVGTGQLPKFAEDIFSLKGDKEMSLISTAEIPVTNLVREQILENSELPIKYTCHSACFRSEAGSYGKDTRGMIRQHQFEKVELVQLVHPEKSYAALEELTEHAETILQRLELPYRVVSLCGGDIGFSAAKTYDLEVWLPAQNCYREISSCSNFEDFQARRMLARFRDPNTKKPELIHTVNGSGLAIGRTLVAIMENYQQADGRIKVPEVLIPYCGGIKVIG